MVRAQSFDDLFDKSTTLGAIAAFFSYPFDLKQSKIAIAEPVCFLSI